MSVNFVRELQTGTPLSTRELGPEDFFALELVGRVYEKTVRESALGPFVAQEPEPDP